MKVSKWWDLRIGKFNPRLVVVQGNRCMKDALAVFHKYSFIKPTKLSRFLFSGIGFLCNKGYENILILTDGLSSTRRYVAAFYLYPFDLV